MFDLKDSVTEASSTERMDAHRATARRVLKALFDVDMQDAPLTDATALSDFAGHGLPGIPGTVSTSAWAIRVKEQVYAYFGIDCEVDEPLVDVLVRLETAEHGVRLVRQR